MTGIGLGIGLDVGGLGGGGNAFSPEASQFFARLATSPSGARKTQYAALIDALVAGGIWAKLDALYVFSAVDSATALTNLKSSSFTATLGGAPVFQSDFGFTGNGSNTHIDTNFNPTTAPTPKFTQDDASFFAWSMKILTDTGESFGSISGGVNALTPYTSNQTAMVVNGGAAYLAASSTGARLYSASRTDATHVRAYSNGALLAPQASNSAAPSNSNFCFLRGEGSSYYAGPVICGGFGSQLSDADHATLYTALNTYMAAVLPVLYAAEGDSITAGFGATNGGYSQLYANVQNGVFLAKNAVTGSQTAQLVSRATTLDTFIQTPFRKKVLSVLIGLNDFVIGGKSTETFMTDLTAYLDARRAAGWTVVVITLLPAQDVGFNAWRGIVNPLIRLLVSQAHADATCDFATNATMGPDAASADTTLFNVDGEHPKDLGHTFLKPDIEDTVNALL